MSRRILPLVLCYLAMMSLAIAVNLLPVFFTTLAADFGHLTNEQLGRIPAVTFVGLVGAIVGAGPLVDRYPKLGPRLAAVGGNVLIGVGLAILAVARSYGVVLAASAVAGFGAGVLDMVLSPIVAALEPKRRTVAMNLLHSFYCTGAVATILAGSLALRLGWGWRAVSAYLVLMPLAVGLAFLFVRLPALVAEGSDRMPLRVLVRERYFLLALVAIFMGGATEMGMATWLPKYAENNLGFARWDAGMAFLGFSLAMAVGRIGVGVVGHRVEPITLLLACCSGSVVLFLIASFGPWVGVEWKGVALAACILAGLTGSCLWPSVLAVAADRYPHGGASMFALLSALGNFGGICMPWIAGAVADVSNLHWGLATAALCPACMIGALLWMRQQRVPVAEAVA